MKKVYNRGGTRLRGPSICSFFSSLFQARFDAGCFRVGSRLPVAALRHVAPHPSRLREEVCYGRSVFFRVRLPFPCRLNVPEPRPPDPALSPPPASRCRPGTRHPPPTVGVDLGRLARLLYSHNPFYCVSAFLVLWGLGKSFRLQGATPRPELLMSGLAGYTLLLAAVGCLLIRAGQLWEDIRTILLLIVLIFLAISMSFDEVLSADLATGRLYFLGGLAFSVVLSELVLRGVRLRLPILFRLPYYALLACSSFSRSSWGRGRIRRTTRTFAGCWQAFRPWPGC